MLRKIKTGLQPKVVEVSLEAARRNRIEFELIPPDIEKELVFLREKDPGDKFISIERFTNSAAALRKLRERPSVEIPVVIGQILLG